MKREKNVSKFKMYQKSKCINFILPIMMNCIWIEKQHQMTNT